ncbi:ABC transporter ATP-binding protein [Rickettsiales bacterium LUAb2]
MSDTLLDIKNLKVKFDLLNKETLYVVNGINLTVQKGESLGVVGESGSGKSQFVLSLMGLLAKNASVEGEVNFKGKSVLNLSLEELNKIRGNEIAMIFQDPMTSLNPYLRIITQMTEVLEDKYHVNAAEAKEKAIDMLKTVGITDPQKRIYCYPHQLSGGMRQRVMIAMAVLSKPELLIADEPTTALDVTIQAQILNLLAKLKQELKLSIIMITHDLGVVANICDKIAIFYGGKIVEYGTAKNIFTDPKHPYTKALINSIPRVDHNKKDPLFVISGNPEPMKQEPNLCVFKKRCPDSFDKCNQLMPELRKVNNGNLVSCLKEDL